MQLVLIHGVYYKKADRCVVSISFLPNFFTLGVLQVFTALDHTKCFYKALCHFRCFGSAMPNRWQMNGDSSWRSFYTVAMTWIYNYPVLRVLGVTTCNRSKESRQSQKFGQITTLLSLPYRPLHFNTVLNAKKGTF
jgi:hypothetical protein